jgi:hypothetical protein
MDQQPEFVPRYNGYLCGTCGKSYATVDLDPGVTPSFMSCFKTEGCPGRCVSMGYPEGPPPLGIPVLIQFYKPSEEEFKKIKHPVLKDHVARGGLVRRAAPDAPEWVKRLA